MKLLVETDGPIVNVTQQSASHDPRDAMLAVAKLGGHLKRNGDPGWITLGRGYERLLTLEEGWKLARSANSRKFSLPTHKVDVVARARLALTYTPRSAGTPAPIAPGTTPLRSGRTRSGFRHRPYPGAISLNTLGRPQTVPLFHSWKSLAASSWSRGRSNHSVYVVET